ncbi:MAG: glycoside hydrolase domain-containing protein, partial [Actinomycetota bacterium]
MSVLAVLAAAVSVAGIPAGPAWSAASSPAAVSTGTPQATRQVQYRGYQVRVPASWPVYHLAADPTRGVLFNTHAVYLGTPGANQQCPARAIGRTNAVLIQPASPAAQLPPGTAVLPAKAAALPARASLPPVAAAAATAAHALQIDVPGPGVLVTATYGADPSEARAILASAKATQQAAARRASTPATASPAQAASSGTAAPADEARPATAGDLVGRNGRGLAFDTCTAPSVSTMSAWRVSPYRVVGTYLGGVNWACSYGNFNSSWVTAVSAQGWQFIPIWVGLQAPCYAHQGAQKMKSAKAYAQGKADAASAVATAQSFGYGKGSPIYFDMEGYPRSNPACTKAVLTFLSGWTRRLHTAGYQSGVYSSANSGISDLTTRYHTAGYPRPDDIWVADWAGNPSLTDPSVPSDEWTGHKR